MSKPVGTRHYSDTKDEIIKLLRESGIALTSYKIFTNLQKKGIKGTGMTIRTYCKDLVISHQIFSRTFGTLTWYAITEDQLLEKPTRSLSEVTKNKMSIAQQKRVYPSLKKKTRIKISCSQQGIKVKDFKGFTNCFPYCDKFNKSLKSRVRLQFDDKCVLCNKTKEENGRLLSVHHVFTEKLACCETKIEEMENVRKLLPKNIVTIGAPEFTKQEIMYIRMMVPLCNSCHKKSHSEHNTPYEKTTFRKLFVELILKRNRGKCF